jgi:RNA polymerase sigma-70 factor (ECF subfamily)
LRTKIAAVESAPDPESEQSSSSLGDVLYAGKATPPASEVEWVALVRSIAAGDQMALHALYERTHRPVYTLIVRIMINREAAEELTLDVFHDIWRRADRYDAANGTVLGWIMNQARSRALDRLRFDRRQKRTQPDGEDPLPGADTPDPSDLVAFQEQSQALRRALVALTPEERVTIETAFFAELTHAEAALRLNQPLGTVKTRIRSGLHKLRHALAGGARKP